MLRLLTYCDFAFEFPGSPFCLPGTAIRDKGEKNGYGEQNGENEDYGHAQRTCGEAQIKMLA